MVRDFVIIVDIKAPNTGEAEAIIHEYLSPIVCSDSRFDADILTGSKTSGGKSTIWDPAPGSLQVPVEFAVIGENPEKVIKDVCGQFLMTCPAMAGWHWSNRHRHLMEKRMNPLPGKEPKSKGHNKLQKG